MKISPQMIREMPDGRTITMYDRGYPLGFVGSADRIGSVVGTPYIYNHLRFVIKFHREDTFAGSRIVGFEVPNGILALRIPPQFFVLDLI